jgi:hypothetical protein
MKLTREFIRLPLAFDADRMADEVRALPESAWQAHPTGYAGNRAVPLVSVRGEANDLFAGPMAATPWLKQSPYLCQVLASFQTVFGRSRLMGLAGGSEVPNHSDVNYHWYSRVRIHVPVITYPEVRFYCHDQSLHMAAGEAWVFDNWKMHRVVNPTSQFRVHLVADTVGSSLFWNMIQESLDSENQDLARRLIAFSPGEAPKLRFEQVNVMDVMHPIEMEVLAEDLLADLVASTAESNTKESVQRFVTSVRAFYQDWKSLWVMFGTDAAGWPLYERRRNRTLRELYSIKTPLILSSTGVSAVPVMKARVLGSCMSTPLPETI